MSKLKNNARVSSEAKEALNKSQAAGIGASDVESEEELWKERLMQDVWAPIITIAISAIAVVALPLAMHPSIPMSLIVMTCAIIRTGAIMTLVHNLVSLAKEKVVRIVKANEHRLVYKAARTIVSGPIKLVRWVCKGCKKVFDAIDQIRHQPPPSLGKQVTSYLLSRGMESTVAKAVMGAMVMSITAAIAHLRA